MFSFIYEWHRERDTHTDNMECKIDFQVDDWTSSPTLCSRIRNACCLIRCNSRACHRHDKWRHDKCIAINWCFGQSNKQNWIAFESYAKLSFYCLSKFAFLKINFVLLFIQNSSFFHTNLRFLFKFSEYFTGNVTIKSNFKFKTKT